MPTSAKTPNRRSSRYPRYILVSPTSATYLSRWVYTQAVRNRELQPSVWANDEIEAERGEGQTGCFGDHDVCGGLGLLRVLDQDPSVHGRHMDHPPDAAAVHLHQILMQAVHSLVAGGGHSTPGASQLCCPEQTFTDAEYLSIDARVCSRVSSGRGRRSPRASPYARLHQGIRAWHPAPPRTGVPRPGPTEGRNPRRSRGGASGRR